MPEPSRAMLIDELRAPGGWSTCARLGACIDAALAEIDELQFSVAAFEGTLRGRDDRIAELESQHVNAEADVDRQYGVWAGNPQGVPEDKTKCVEEVPTRTWGMENMRWAAVAGWRKYCYSQCSRKRGHGPGGLYCAQHEKSKIKVIKP